MGQQLPYVGCAGVPVHGHHGQQHQDRTEQCVQKELVAGIDPTLAAPNPDDQEHRDQTALEEGVEENQIKGAEHADHEHFQKQKRDHVFLDPGLDRFPARKDAEGHQRRRQQNEQDGNAVDAHLIGNGTAQPIDSLHHLEVGIGGIELRQDQKRKQEVDNRHQQRDQPDVAMFGRLVFPGEQQDQGRAKQRQEGYDR